MRVHRPRRSGAAPAALAILALASACSSPTASEALEVAVEAVQPTSEAEFLAWPSKPVVGGTEAVEVRGTALAGCGTLAAEASLRGDLVSLRVVTHGDRSPCELSRWAWQPFVARTGPLPPGRYQVRVSTVGHPAPVRARLVLGAP